MSALLREFRTGVVATRMALKRDYWRNYVATREVELIPCNAQGRVGDPNYCPLSCLSVSWVQVAAADLLRTYPDATHVAVEVGFDLYASFGEYMQNQRHDAGYDYDPRVEHYSVDLPRDVVLRPGTETYRSM